MMFNEIDRLAGSYLADNKGFSFLYLDLDDFNKVNDIVSHSMGDMVLARIVQRWRSVIRQGDILGRLGGDEFGLLITSDMEEDELKKYIDRFRSVLKETLILKKKELFVTASYGLVRFPNNGTDVTELMRNADIAMNRAKADGKNGIRVFDYDMHEGIINRLQMESGLLNCIRNKELFVVFQPMFQCNTRKLRGFEVLARWNYPGMGLVSPATFIPIAEETGLIIEIGKWILSYTLNRFMTYKKIYQHQGVVSINISVVQLSEPNFVTMIKEILNETGFDSSLLELEITESVMISCPEKTIETLSQLRELGIRISLDDFGTGYASLCYLQMLPINVLKIDRSFIDKICGQEHTNNIVGNIISLAHQLGMEVVAEGVEVEEQLKYLTEKNCDFVQGYLLGKPLDEEDFITLIKTI